MEIQRNRRQFNAAADKVALGYLLSGNYDPYAYISALKNIELTIDNSFAQKNEQNKIISELLSTHPSITTRMKHVNKILDSYRAYTLKYRDYEDRFINNTNGMTLYADNSGRVPEKYVVRYVNDTSLKIIKEDDELFKYILLINQVETSKNLEKKNRIKRIYKE